MTEHEHEPQLELVQEESEPSDHDKIMAAYARLNQALDSLLERRRLKKQRKQA